MFFSHLKYFPLFKHAISMLFYKIQYVKKLNLFTFCFNFIYFKIMSNYHKTMVLLSVLRSRIEQDVKNYAKTLENVRIFHLFSM